jgi:predicted RNase H-like HicB family nuclease
MKIEIERETDGRWIAEIPELPGVMVYGDTRKQAIAKAEALALRVMAGRIEETLHLVSIPGMKASIQNGLKTPVEKCDEEPGW